MFNLSFTDNLKIYSIIGISSLMFARLYAWYKRTFLFFVSMLIYFNNYFDFGAYEKIKESIFIVFLYRRELDSNYNTLWIKETKYGELNCIKLDGR